jgi:excisionase family DNA binding protein
MSIDRRQNSSSKEHSMQPLLVSIDEGARIVGLGRTMLYQLIAKNQIKSVKIGRARRIVLTDLEAYIERLRAEASDAGTAH